MWANRTLPDSACKLPAYNAAETMVRAAKAIFAVLLAASGQSNGMQAGSRQQPPTAVCAFK